ncbi:hypothetical protein BC829DRAFT_444074 [Chytridium lagenaria]|nr:hypothetical protein BC829DRAFT_444074 [Chytridium lagenaria]
MPNDTKNLLDMDDTDPSRHFLQPPMQELQNHTQPLPEGWVLRYDPKTNRPFYVDTKTAISTWEDPRPKPSTLSKPPVRQTTIQSDEAYARRIAQLQIDEELAIRLQAEEEQSNRATFVPPPHPPPQQVAQGYPASYQPPPQPPMIPQYAPLQPQYVQQQQQQPVIVQQAPQTVIIETPGLYGGGLYGGGMYGGGFYGGGLYGGGLYGGGLYGGGLYAGRGYYDPFFPGVGVGLAAGAFGAMAVNSMYWGGPYCW